MKTKSIVLSICLLVAATLSLSTTQQASAQQTKHLITESDWRDLETGFKNGCLRDSTVKSLFGSSTELVCSCVGTLVVADLKKMGFKYLEDLRDNKGVIESVSFKDGEACGEAVMSGKLKGKN